MSNNIREKIDRTRMELDKRYIEIVAEYTAFRRMLSQKPLRMQLRELKRENIETMEKQISSWQLAMDGGKANFESEKGRAKAAFNAAEKTINKTEKRLDRLFEAWPETMEKEGK